MRRDWIRTARPLAVLVYTVLPGRAVRVSAVWQCTCWSCPNTLEIGEGFDVQDLESHAEFCELT